MNKHRQSMMVTLLIAEDDDTRMIVDAGTVRERSVATFRFLMHVSGSGETTIAVTRAHDATEAVDLLARRLTEALRER